MAEQIYMMEQGRIIEEGTHEELLESNKAYQEIYYSQFEKNAAKTGAENRR